MADYVSLLLGVFIVVFSLGMVIMSFIDKPIKIKLKISLYMSTLVAAFVLLLSCAN
jgi:hypothetical protein